MQCNSYATAGPAVLLLPVLLLGALGCLLDRRNRERGAVLGFAAGLCVDAALLSGCWAVVQRLKRRRARYRSAEAAAAAALFDTDCRASPPR